jgi:hypothetical protein
MRQSIGVVILVLCGCGMAVATPLNLAVAVYPDITVTTVNGIYNATTVNSTQHDLILDGLAASLTLPVNPCFSPVCTISNSAPIATITNPITDSSQAFGGNFLINAEIDSSGNLIVSPPSGTDTLTVTGNVATLGDGTPLLSANLTQFGFSTVAGSGVYQFVFTITGGSLANIYGGTGQMLDVLVSDPGVNGLPSVFTSNFTTSASGFADIKAPATPEPASMLLLLSGGGILGLLRKRLRKTDVV